MNVYKLTVNDWTEKPLDREVFETETGRKKPWYVSKETGVPSCFAVCPACDNPIQILGFYHALKNTEKPYARHVPQTVPNLAIYQQENYDFCPYAANRNYDSQARRREGDLLGEKILDILVPNFDRVIFILEAVVGFKISDNLAEALLKDYYGQAGYRYTGATLQNIPWVFAYMTLSKSLLGRVITDNELVTAVQKKVKDIVINPTAKGQQVSWVDSKKFVELDFCFMHHRARLDQDGSLKESMKMVVRQRNNADVYSKTIEFDRARFRSLINVPEEKAKRPRQASLVAMAERVFGVRDIC